MSDLTSPVTCRCGASASWNSDDARLSRRALLGGALAGTIAAAARPVAAQIDGTPPAPPVPASTLVADKAAELLWDQDAIFRFVADEVLYEAYPGALRGAEGALLSRSANSVDTALLLAALLDEAAIPHRFASGPLEPSVAEDWAALPGRAGYEQDRLELALADIPRRLASRTGESEPPVPSQEVDAWLRSQEIAMTDASARAATWTNQAVDDIASALAAAGIDIAAVPPISLPDRERNEHMWVQVADGPEWIDLDPTAPGAEAGKAFASAAQTLDAVPDELYHRVRVRVIVEEMAGGTAQQRDAVTREFTSVDLVHTPLAITMYNADAMKSVGVGITELFSGAATFAPAIIAGMSAETADIPIVFGSDAPSVFGALDPAEGEGGVADGETLAMWYAVEVSGPDREPAVAQRTWLDRLGPVARASGELDAASILPVTVTDGQNGGVSVTELEKTVIVSVEAAPVPAADVLLDNVIGELFANTNVLGPARGELRIGLTLEHEVPAGFRSAIVAPHVTAFVFQPASDGEMGVMVDLMHHSPAIVPDAAEPVSTPSVHPGVLTGVLDYVSERLLFGMLANGPDATGGGEEPTDAASANVGTVFDLAREQEIPVRAIQQEGELDALEVPDGAARDGIAAALAEGKVVIVPARPVTFGDVTRLGWWIVEPATGLTIDRMDDGTGSSGFGNVAGGRFFSVLPEWAVVALEWLVSIKGFRCLAGIIGVASGTYLALGSGTSDSPAASAAAASTAITGALANCIF